MLFSSIVSLVLCLQLIDNSQSSLVQTTNLYKKWILDDKTSIVLPQRGVLEKDTISYGICDTDKHFKKSCKIYVEKLKEFEFKDMSLCVTEINPETENRYIVPGMSIVPLGDKRILTWLDSAKSGFEAEVFIMLRIIDMTNCVSRDIKLSSEYRIRRLDSYVTIAAHKDKFDVIYPSKKDCGSDIFCSRCKITFDTEGNRLNEPILFPKIDKKKLEKCHAIKQEQQWFVIFLSLATLRFNIFMPLPLSEDYVFHDLIGQNIMSVQSNGKIINTTNLQSLKIFDKKNNPVDEKLLRISPTNERIGAYFTEALDSSQEDSTNSTTITSFQFDSRLILKEKFTIDFDFDVQYLYTFHISSDELLLLAANIRDNENVFYLSKINADGQRSKTVQVHINNPYEILFWDVKAYESSYCLFHIVEYDTEGKGISLELNNACFPKEALEIKKQNV